jgi:hypothetical protein
MDSGLEVRHRFKNNKNRMAVSKKIFGDMDSDEQPPH